MDNAGTRSGLCHKALNFDLITAALKEHYPGRDYRKAYRDIRAFLNGMGFDHRQGSGYRSRQPLSDVDVLDVTDGLYSTFPWFVNCVRKFDATDVGEVYDLAKFYENYDVTAAQDSESATQRRSVLEQLDEGKQKAAAREQPEGRRRRDKDRTR